MNNYTLDVEHFISEIKKYPELWDINSEEYRYKTKKQAAWCKIANVFIQDYEEMEPLEKEDVYKKLFAKWRNIRDSFVRHLRRKDCGKKGYMYAKNLDFLTNLYCKQSASDESTDDENSSFLKPKIEMFNWSEDDSVGPKRKRKAAPAIPVEIENPLLPVTETCSYPVNVEDEDRSFFESLLPAVRSFDLDQKLEFRCEVLELIKKIRNGEKARIS